jgi:membrane protease YdiL (CAAX protease family)
MERRSLVILVVVASELLLRLVYMHVLLPASPLFSSDAAKLFYTAAARLFQMGVIFYLAFYLCGLKTKDFKKEVLIGLGVSLAFGGAVLLSDLASRMVMQGGWLKFLLARQSFPNPLLFLLVGCVFGPFVEELFFRGVMYSWLRERVPAVAAVVLSSLIFAGLHPGFAIQFAGGLLFTVLYEWRRNIWPGFIVHAAANVGIWVVPWVYPL